MKSEPAKVHVIAFNHSLPPSPIPSSLPPSPSLSLPPPPSPFLPLSSSPLPPSLLPLSLSLSQSQYDFLHHAILEAIMCRDTTIAAVNMSTKIVSLKGIVPSSGKTGFQSQFEVSAKMHA